MKFDFIAPNIVHFTYPTQYEVCSAFIRIQEFYESPNPQFRGQFFTMDEYMDWYASEKDGFFSYFEDWVGFNIPGHIVKRFYDRFTPTCIRPKEMDIIKPLLPLIEKGEKFYIIGTMDAADPNTVAHELRHAAYYVNDEFRAACDEVYKTIPDEIKTLVHNWLSSMGYTSAVWADEVQAYFGTERDSLIQFRLETDIPLKKYTDAYAAIKY